MYSKQLGIAGTMGIVEYNGELAIIDFKTSKKPKPRDWIEHYFVQCCAYACMLFELTGIVVKKFVILMSCENGNVSSMKNTIKQSTSNYSMNILESLLLIDSKHMKNEITNELEKRLKVFLPSKIRSRDRESRSERRHVVH